MDGPGFEITLTRGPNTYSPVKYNTFTVGPVSVRVQPGDQEALTDTYARADRLVGALYDLEYARALQTYMQDLRRTAETVRIADARRSGA